MGGEHGSTLKQKKCGVRFIPAWAGNTTVQCRSFPFPPVHPRVGGEHIPAPIAVRTAVGSSPRGRGTLRPDLMHPSLRRFIPAWAGNTFSPISSAFRCAVHPRVGGEHLTLAIRNSYANGSSPRGRGTRGRSVPDRYGHPFIPAWAGNTDNERRATSVIAFHPRVGGEHALRTLSAISLAGSSPRGRGTLNRLDDDKKDERFIPAWAGNTYRPLSPSVPPSVHPRVGGEHSDQTLCIPPLGGSSPRGRGTPSPSKYAREDTRFIPAWAGNTAGRRGCRRRRPVHPRVGGEHT